MQALWDMLYAEDAGIVPRSPESPEKVMSVIVRVARLLGLMVPEPKTEISCACCRSERRSARSW